MLNSTLSSTRILLFVVFITAVPVYAHAQTQNPAERQHAIEVYESQNLVAALPLLEKAALAYPNDPAVLSRLGFTLYANSTDEKDPTKRQQLRQRSLSVLRKSRSLGDDSNLTSITLEALESSDSSQVPFSNIRTADAAIREGESAFMRGDMDKAIAAYRRALEADPHLYTAALFAGDSEFKKAMNSTDPQFRTVIGATRWMRKVRPMRRWLSSSMPSSPNPTAGSAPTSA
jgi:tetratricopeptide (TPR) repeat protein